MSNDLVMAGMLLTILGAFAGTVWKVLSFLGGRLFEQDKGIITKALDKWLAQHEQAVQSQQLFMNSLDNRDREQMTVCKDHALLSASTSHDISSVKAAGMEACKMCRELLENPSESVKTRLDNIEKALG